MDYNISGGGEHFIRMSQVVYKHLMGEDQLTAVTERQVYLLGWAVEMVTFEHTPFNCKFIFFFLNFDRWPCRY